MDCASVCVHDRVHSGNVFRPETKEGDGKQMTATQSQHTLTISDDHQHLILKTTYEALHCAKAAPGNWVKDKKVWIYPASVDVIDTLKKAYYDANKMLIAQTNELYFWAKETREREEESQALKIRDDLPAIPITKYTAWNHQLQAYHFCYGLKSAFLHMHMGTGKTKVVIDLILNRPHFIEKILILCPKSVIPVWEAECEKHCPDSSYLVAIPLIGTSKQKMAILNSETFGGTECIVTNFESMLTLDIRKRLNEIDFDLCIIDESHRIKSPSGKISKFIATLGQGIEYKMCLTGTPMPKSPLDIYAQFRFLDPGIYGTSYVRFRDKYAYLDHFNQPYSYHDMDDLREKMERITYHAGPEVLDLPDITEQTRYFNMDSVNYNKYHAVMDTFFSKVAEDSQVTVEYAITAMLRGQQITGGFVKDDNGVLQTLHRDKIALLKDTLEDIGPDEPVVIFCRFIRDIELLGGAILEPVSYLHGRANGVSDWQNGDTRILIAQIQSGSVGIDLTRAAYAIYYTLDWNLGNYEQSRARIHRPGQDRSCTLIHLAALGPDNQSTIDGEIITALSKREDFIKKVLAGEINRG